MVRKTILIVLISLIASTSFAMEVNKQVVGDKGLHFVKAIDDQMSGYIRVMRRSSERDFDALSLVIFMNQTANLEKKLDILINETRKTNRLLSLQMKSSNKIIDIMSQVKSVAKPALGKGD